MAELRVAKAWGLNPETWDALSMEARAEMIAYERMDGMMTRYDMEHRK